MVICQSSMTNTYIHVPVLKIDKTRKLVLKLSDINNSLSITPKSYEENLNGKKAFQNDNKQVPYSLCYCFLLLPIVVWKERRIVTNFTYLFG